MRIERIELDGFGRFHDAGWPLAEGLTVLVGANEAGKTTLLNGLRALLFGFEPTRDGRTWYPAFAGGRRGGRLVLRTAGGERWTVERHGEKGGAGSLAVTAPNGNQGGQETLDRLLRGADRDLFNNIFAFGLGELQALASLSADGVRGRIYGAGAGLGGTSAVDLERRLRQQLDAAFLPRGSQRPLNARLARIDELRRDVADLARQPEEHAAAHRERAALLRRAEAGREAIRVGRERIGRLGRLRDARPIAAELSVVQEELGAGDAALDAFPDDAIALLDRRLGELGEARTVLAALDEQLSEARMECSRLALDEAVLAIADEVTAVVELRAERLAAAAQRGDLESAHARSAAVVVEQLAQAGGWDEASLLALNDSIPTVEATRAHERDLQAARAAAADARQRHRSAVDEMEIRDREGAIDEGSGPSSLDARSAAIRDLDEIRLRIAVTEAARGDRVARLSPSMGRVIAAALVLIGLAGGMLLQMPLIGLAMGGILAILVIILSSKQAGPGSADLDALRQERGVLLAVLGLPAAAADADIRAAAEVLAREQARQQLAHDQRSSLEARREDLERRAREAQVAAAAADAATATWRDWLAARGLPLELTPDAARQVLAAAGFARRAAAERDGHRRRLDEIRAADDAYTARVNAVLEGLALRSSSDSGRREALVIGLGARLEEAREARRRAMDLEAAIARLVARREPAIATVVEREAALADLVATLGGRDADAVRHRAAQAASRRTLRGRSRELHERLAGIAGSVEAIGELVSESAGADPAALNAGIEEDRLGLERLEADEREALGAIGGVEARIRQLEAAEDLGTRRQELAMLEGQAGAMAREWSVRALALRLLEETRARYERERQPDVVRAAESHFERITAGRYSRIVAPPGDASVRVETEGGEGRVTDELSRGTSEQLYLALRFGLIEQFARQAEPLPVVMDDILVNFDAERAARAASAIADLATRHQVVYFTCHPWTAELLDPGGDRTLALD